MNKSIQTQRMAKGFRGKYAAKRWEGYAHFVFTYCFITTHINKPCIKPTKTSMMVCRFGISNCLILKGYMLVNIHRKKMRRVNHCIENRLNIWMQARKSLCYNICFQYTPFILVLAILAVGTHRSYCSCCNDKYLLSRQSLAGFMRCCLPNSLLSSDLWRP